MKQFLKGKKILLGISGSIAAYKTPELIRLMKKSGASVKTILTDGGSQFVTPTTIQAVSGSDIYFGKQSFEQESKMTHIALARWADVVLVAPASANLIARLAHGFADDLLTTVCLVTKSPIVVAPAMNVGMWDNVATQKNLNELKIRGIEVWGPESGEQACGEDGEGRMEEPETLIDNLKNFFLKLSINGLLSGKKVVITAGPTVEPIDPVRFLSNNSSGLMGYSLANVAARNGASVTLISGPTNIDPPESANTIKVQTAVEMLKAVLNEVRDADIFISCAAVADYKVKKPSSEKIKKSDDILKLELEPNEDIISAVANLEKRPFMVGFAAETNDLLKNAKAKLERKSLDVVVANLVGLSKGFGNVENSITVISRNKEPIDIPKGSKGELSEKIIQFVCSELS